MDYRFMTEPQEGLDDKILTYHRELCPLIVRLMAMGGNF